MKRFFINLTLSLVVSFICLALADTLLKAFLFIPNDNVARLVRFEDTLSPKKRLRPQLDDSFTGAYREFTYQVKTNKAGFRHAPERKDYDVLLLGDSQTFGVGVDDDQTFAATLEKKSGLSVLNTGCPGYNTFEQTQLLETLLAQGYVFKSVTLIFFLGNDPIENKRFQKNRLRGGTERKPLMATFKDFLVRHSSIYHSVIQLRRFESFNQLFKKLGLVESGYPDELETFHLESNMILSLQAIKKMSSIAKRAGMFFNLVLLPDRYQVENAYWQAWAQKYGLNENEFDLFGPNKKLQAFAQQNEISFLDLTPSLRKLATADEPLYWPIDSHLSIRGHEVVAELLSKGNLL